VTESPAPDGRRIAALLANAEIRAVWARIVLGERVEAATAGLAPGRASRIIDGLLDAGLVDVVDEEVVASETVFAALLTQWPAPARPTGVDRFLRDGRIDRYPSNAADRQQLFAWVAETAFEPDEVLSEAEINERLSTRADDVALLRRHLVDAGLLLRTPSGSSYSRS
jgi:hypothetical protein